MSKYAHDIIAHELKRNRLKEMKLTQLIRFVKITGYYSFALTIQRTTQIEYIDNLQKAEPKIA